MAKVPTRPKIYHITHLRNLPRIIEAGVLWSDRKRLELGMDCDVVGMPHIKQRRMYEIDVDCHSNTRVGDYVPFYFCPRSVMLYLLHRGNHPDLNYTEGQQPILHLEADLRTVVAWADQARRRWAFTDRNAGAYYVDFFDDLDELQQLNWLAINADQWNDSRVKDGKQAEFLIHESFPWELVERIGVLNARAQKQVEEGITKTDHKPHVQVTEAWYYPT